MRGLHRLLNDSQQVLTQLIQVDFLAQGGAEGCHGLSSIVLAAVEAAINDPLDAMTQGLEEGRDYQRRGDNDQGILLLLSEESAQQGTEDEHDAHVEQGQDHGQGTIDQRATNEDINLP